MKRSEQLLLFSDPLSQANGGPDTSSTFVENMSLPVHRWFRFSAGFSADWAESVIKQAMANGKTRVIDPFAGSGTTLLAAEDAGAESIGIEAHPFLFRVARAKLFRRTNVDDYVNLIRQIRRYAVARTARVDHYPTLIKKCYTPEALTKLDTLRQAIEYYRDDSAPWMLAWLTLVSILRVSSCVGTAQWQYVLPKKEKKRSLEPFDAFDASFMTFVRDMQTSRAQVLGPSALILQGDARTCAEVPDSYATLVVTSPPYPNNFDYADATRLEMSFFGEITGWGDLQARIRSNLIRSCSQHVPPNAVQLSSILARDELSPIRPAITEVCEQLAQVRLTKGGKKTYHLMVACYFYDLAVVWQSLRRVCAPKSRVCFVIGDSAPYGVYVPVIEWLGELAKAAGFSGYHFEKTRERNVKWKNRKHRVPLCEGRLWVDG
jgi:hypothetical protein